MSKSAKSPAARRKPAGTRASPAAPAASARRAPPPGDAAVARRVLLTEARGLTALADSLNGDFSRAVLIVAPGLMEGTRMTTRLAPTQVQNALATAVLGKAADRDDVADQVVTFARSDTTTGQTMVIDAGRFFH